MVVKLSDKRLTLWGGMDKTQFILLPWFTTLHILCVRINLLQSVTAKFFEINISGTNVGD